MSIDHSIAVYESDKVCVRNGKTVFVMDTNDTLPCFTHLRLYDNYATTPSSIKQELQQHRGDNLLSNQLSRIAGGSNSGRLEVYHNRLWGTVCDDHFDLNDAHAACRMIGFSSAESFYTAGYGIGQIWLDDIACYGHEHSLTDCIHPAWGQHNCGHVEDVGINCVEARIDGGSNSGRLEINYNGIWGTVCDDTFDLNDADVACRMIGFSSAESYFTSGGGSGQIWLDDMACYGHEISLTECVHKAWGQHNCGHGEDVGINCVEARFVGESNSGRLEIYHNGLWGTICDDTFDINDAHVACRMIGFSSAESFYTAGGGSGQIWLDDIECYGHEYSLTTCTHAAWGEHNCGHDEDVGVNCVEGTVSLNILASLSSAESYFTSGGGSGQIWLDDMACYGHEISLTECVHKAWGQHNCGHGEDVGINCVEARFVGESNSGRLKIYHNGLWGTICDDTFDINDAHVACRMIGFSSAESFYTAGGGSGQIWLDDMECYGHEYYLTTCTHAAWGEHNCDHGEDVGVNCVEARIVGSSNNGRLEIYHNGQWGTVCDDYFDLNDAHVACRMIGFNAAESFNTIGNGDGEIWLDDMDGEIWLDDMDCEGYEYSLTDCTHTLWADHNCDHGEDIGVYCVKVRMNGNPTNLAKDENGNSFSMRKITFWELYGVKRFPYRGKRKYTPLLSQSFDGGMIISNDVFGLTIRQFERMYKACLERRKTHEQWIINLRYPDKSSNEYLEYLENCTDCHKGNNYDLSISHSLDDHTWLQGFDI
ncbi:scavenger receptor cysteine-rich type 1 protein M130-like [Mytilus trossulus]|uniref:scavenger receptor cysteine-rich type 1 protein M130-like n=1 Tax=Mytilus trossulus TaxID=6551 RepID=UPI0030045B54